MKRYSEWTPDASQQAVIDAHGGYHLVLAPPGCGKTQILTERVRRAREQGVPYEDMLCLTFTNRAARGMQERIHGQISDSDIAQLYIGNIHRFCSKFLYDNALIEAGSSIIDDEDALSILARYLDEQEDEVKDDYRRRHGYEEIIQLSHFMYQIEHRHPKALRLHADCLTKDDVEVMRRICQVERRPFDAAAMIDIYEHTDYYSDAVKTEAYDYAIQQLALRLLRKMRYAHAFRAYQRQNHLVDFEDLLLLTYDALRSGEDHRRYPWIQVDEVQDLNPLQLAIIDQLSTLTPQAPDAAAGEVLYLGDEQQAIFSFMGAKMDTLTQLKARCSGRIHHLSVNHRSPRYLLEVFNEYAKSQLDIDEELLPDTADDRKGTGRELKILYSDTLEGEYEDVARFVGGLFEQHPSDTTAVVVSSNRDADEVSACLHRLRLPHFKVSGQDLFSTPEVKMLLAHLNVLTSENNFICWSRLLKGLGVFQTNAAAREFMRKLFNRAMLPSDFLLYDDSTYVQEFVALCEQEEVVVFDTETTGLNVFEDDILQIAAVKVRDGRKVPGSEFSVHIETEREIPPMLGRTVNPIIEERRRHTLLSHREALMQFMAYVGNDVLIGHNVEFDYHILDFNLRRYVPRSDLRVSSPRYYDTLKLLRMLVPDLHSYRLDDFRKQHLFGIEEDEAHLADVDVDDTLKVLRHCYQQGRGMIVSQMEFLSQQNVQNRIEVFRKAYMEIYFHSRELLHERSFKSSEPVLVSEMRSVYQHLLEADRMMPIEKLHYIFEYLSHDILCPEEEPSLIEQLQGHIMEINTLKEADLCNSSTIRDRIFVTTVHKAKGLEFDNVIVFDAVDGRYPNYYHQNNQRLLEEDRRKFYVAISRARKRLFVSQSLTRIDYQGQPHRKLLTPFMHSIARFFS